MKKLSLILNNFVIILFFISTSNSYCFEITTVSFGKGLDKVIDGDTIQIGKKKIRFSGIDAPESFYKGKQQICYDGENKIYCGKISKEILTKIIKNRRVMCRGKELDRYGRYLAECFLLGYEETSVSSAMVRSGYAFDYPKYSKKKYFKDQEYAKSNKLGIWNYEFKYPWEWRKKYKKYKKFTVGYNKK